MLVQALKPLLVELPSAEIEAVLLAWTPNFQRLVMDNIRYFPYPMSVPDIVQVVLKLPAMHVHLWQACSGQQLKAACLQISCPC